MVQTEHEAVTRSKPGRAARSAGLAAILALAPLAGPDANPGCVAGTAEHYAQRLGLPLKVSSYDTNGDSYGGCFTGAEKAFFNRLHEMMYPEDDAVDPISTETAQALIDRYETVGSLTVEPLGYWSPDREGAYDEMSQPDLLAVPGVRDLLE